MTEVAASAEAIVRLKSLRTSCGMTQELLAARLGVTPQAVARWESGKNPVPTKYLRELASLLGTSVTELVGPNERD